MNTPPPLPAPYFNPKKRLVLGLSFLEQTVARFGVKKDAQRLHRAIVEGASSQIETLLAGRGQSWRVARVLRACFLSSWTVRVHSLRAQLLMEWIDTPAEVLALCASCALAGDETGWRALLQAMPAQQESIQDLNEPNALFVAIEHQQESLFMELLRRAPEQRTSVHPRTQESLLSRAASRGLVRVVEALATVDSAAHVDANEENALMSALRPRQQWGKNGGVDLQRVHQCVRWIAPLSDPIQRSNERAGACTALLWAARHAEDSSTLLAVLQAGSAREVLPTGSKEGDALQAFARETAFLARTQQKETALMILAKRGKVDLLNTLLDHAPWPQPLQREAFICALNSRELDCAERLCEAALAEDEKLYFPLLPPHEMPRWRYQAALRQAREERQAIQDSMTDAPAQGGNQGEAEPHSSSSLQKQGTARRL